MINGPIIEVWGDRLEVITNLIPSVQRPRIRSSVPPMLTQLCSLTKPTEEEVLCVRLKAKRKEEINKFRHDSKVCEAQHEHVSRDLQIIPRISRVYEPTVLYQPQCTTIDDGVIFTRICIDRCLDSVLEGVVPNTLSSAQRFRYYLARNLATYLRLRPSHREGMMLNIPWAPFSRSKKSSAALPSSVNK